MKKISVTSKFSILAQELYPDDVITIYDGIYNLALVTGEYEIAIWVFGEHEWVFVAEYPRSECHRALKAYENIKNHRTPSVDKLFSEEQAFFNATMNDDISIASIPF